MILPAGIGSVLVARHHRHDLHRGRGARWSRVYAGLVLSFQDQNSLRACDHSGGGGDLRVFGAVRSVSGLVRQLFPGRHLEA